MPIAGVVRSSHSVGKCLMRRHDFESGGLEHIRPCTAHGISRVFSLLHGRHELEVNFSQSAPGLPGATRTRTVNIASTVRKNVVPEMFALKPESRRGVAAPHGT